MFLIYIIIVGLVAGWATGKIMKGSGYGPIVDILLGIAGAIIGSRLLGLFGIYTSGGLIPSILVAIVGAVVLVLLVRLIKRA
ncbi:MAG: GlsB/YeaQ/YmgE family stress response membrane protein [Terriglobales bacterium]